jgi:hypothetical protein
VQIKMYMSSWSLSLKMMAWGYGGIFIFQMVAY